MSPLLLLPLQTVVFCDIERELFHAYPLAITPTVPFFDAEFAHDAVLSSRNSEHLQALLHVIEVC